MLCYNFHFGILGLQTIIYYLNCVRFEFDNQASLSPILIDLTLNQLEK